MFFPLNTDAPIYHFPAATLGLILTNVAAFVLTGVGLRPELVDPWILHFGAIQPYQWLTAMFMHVNGLHLAGNMIFLWAFGLITEGKLGWQRFLAIYLLLGIAQFGVEQVIMSGADREAMRVQQLKYHGLEENYDGKTFNKERLEKLRQNPELIKMLRKQPVMYGALGASGAIYSLIAMSLIWAPRNEITIWFILARGTFEMTILTFAAWYIGLDFLYAWLGGFSMSTSFLHIMGAIFGAIAGIVLFKKKIVDCEDWDLFSVLSGDYGSSRRDMYGYRRIDDERAIAKNRSTAETEAKKTKLEQIQDLIQDEEYSAASQAMLVLETSYPDKRLPPFDHARLAIGLMVHERYEEAEVHLESFIEANPENSAWATARLAAIQLQVNRQPRAAIQSLKLADSTALTAAEREICDGLTRRAKAQIEAGIEDLEPDW